MKQPLALLTLLTFLASVSLPFISPCQGAEAWHPGKGILMTRWAKDVSPENALPAYPRPQMVRDNWLNLNGLWNYQITEKNDENIPGQFAGKILVPFCIESPLSGVMQPLTPNQRLWYERDFSVPAGWDGKNVLLHFGAVDWQTTVYVDGRKLGSHRGGYDSFGFDITKSLQPGTSHKIVVSVWDPTDSGVEGVLNGKQTLRPPGGASYTATSGIWQTVWLESVPDSYVEKLRIVPDLDKGVLKLTVSARTVPHPLKVQVVVSDQGRKVASVSADIGDELTPDVQRNLVTFFKSTASQVSTELEIPIPNPKTWSPDSPFLYDLSVRITDTDGKALDTVSSYFAMRSVKLGHDTDGNPRLLLNGQPILMPGALDQGFWPDGVYTAPTDDALKFDIQWAKKLGLNTVRKHVKIEPARWYYWADKLGLMVFQDLPTGNSGDPQTDLPTSPEAADQWRAETRHIIEDKFNNPSIVCWDVFNEAFGGFDYAQNAALVKEIDGSRLVDESSGFPWHGSGDVLDGHGAPDYKDKNRVSIISESITANFGAAGHQWPYSWSYISYDTKTGKEMDFMSSYLKNKETAVLPNLTPEAKIWLTKKVGDFYGSFLKESPQSGLSGRFYCQLIDVETECDGLMSYDREVPKVDAGQVAKDIRGNTPKLNAVKAQ